MRSPGTKVAGSPGAEGASKGPDASSAPPGTDASIGWTGGASVAPVGWPELGRRRARAARCFRASGPGGPLSGWPQCSFTSREKRSQSPRVFRHGASKDQVVRQELKTYSNWPTYPQLYVKGELIGGCDIILDMANSGELKEALA